MSGAGGRYRARRAGRGIGGGLLAKGEGRERGSGKSGQM